MHQKQQQKSATTVSEPQQQEGKIEQFLNKKKTKKKRTKNYTNLHLDAFLLLCCTRLPMNMHECAGLHACAA